MNIEDPYESDSTALFQCEQEELDQEAARNVDDEITSSPHDRKEETLNSDRGISSQDSSVSPQRDEPLLIPRPHNGLNGNLLSLRLLRHFKEGPGQW